LSYQHIFSLKTARIAGLSVEWHLEILKLIMPGLRINRGRLEMGVGIPRITFGGIAKTFSGPPGSIASPSYLEDVAGTKIQAMEADSPGSPGTKDTGFSFRVGTAGTFANPTTYCAQEPCSVEIEAPINAERVCMGDPNITQPVLSGKFRVSGSFRRELVDDDFLEFFRAGDPVYLRMQYDGPGPIIVAGSQHWQCIIDIPYARIARAGASIDGAGPINEEIPWVIAPPTQTATDAITITLFNKLSTVA
jgi:hypothetical protein